MIDLIIITGASKGICNNIAKKCSHITKNMIGIARNVQSLEVENPDCNLIKLNGDLFYFEDLRKNIEQEISKLENKEPINSIGLVLGGGTVGEHGGLFDSAVPFWANTFNTNVLGNLNIIKACKKQLDNKAKLRAVVFGGGGAAYGFPDFSGYALSKVATVRAAENIGMEFDKLGYNASIIAIAPGAVQTDILKKIVKHGGYIKTKTNISEPTNFVYRFLNDEMPSKKMNGRFFHVRDDVFSVDFSNNELYKIRRLTGLE